MVGRDELKPPIFLLGNVRSGTTMIQRILGMHPEVVTWFEPRPIWVYADPKRPHDRFVEADATEPVKRYIRRRFLRYQRAHGGLRIMEKTPSNLMRIPYVQAIFPEARYIYTVRNPLSCLSSAELKWQQEITWGKTRRRIAETPLIHLPYYGRLWLREKFRRRVLRQKYTRLWGVRYPGIENDVGKLSVEEIVAKQWVACCRQADQDLAEWHEENLLRIRYETFVADPVAESRRVCEHVGLPFPDELADRIAAFVDPNRQGKWRRLDRDVFARCLPVLCDEMRRQGYEVPDDLVELIGAEAAPSPAG